MNYFKILGTTFLMVSALLVNTVLAEQSVCPAETPLIGREGECLPCDTSEFTNDVACSEKCPNRRWHEYRKTCELVACLPEKPLYVSANAIFGGSCLPCDTKEDIDVLGDWECAQCPNRQFFESGYGGGICTLACPKNEPIRYKSDSNEDKQSFKCYSCNSPKAIDLNRKYGEYNCLQCPNREIKKGKCILKGECPKEYPIRDTDGACRASNDPRPIVLDFDKKDECNKYPERMLDGIICVLKTCPASYPMRYNDGCYACDDEKIDVDKKTCDLCPNRIHYTSGKGQYNHCISCPPDKPIPDAYGKCHSCDKEEYIYTDACGICSNRYQKDRYCYAHCSNEKPLQSTNGKCYACEDKTTHIDVLTKENCEKCPNRTYFEKDKHIKQCITCSTNEPLISSETGRCYSCDTTKSVPTIIGHKGNEICSDLRQIINGFSVLKNCPTDKPLRDKNNACYSCDDNYHPINVEGVRDNCKICPNRIVKYNHCIIPEKDKPIISIDKYSVKQYACETKGDYKIGLRKINVTGTEDSCLQCPNRKIAKEKKYDKTIESYCVAKDK